MVEEEKRVNGELIKNKIKQFLKKHSREEDIWIDCWQETQDRARGKVENSKGNLLNIHLELTKWEEKQISNIRTGAMLAYISWWDIFFFPTSVLTSKPTATPELIREVRALCSFLLMHAVTGLPGSFLSLKTPGKQHLSNPAEGEHLRLRRGTGKSVIKKLLAG